LIGASATVSNAQEFAELLFDRPVIPIFCDQGKKGLIHFLMLYPESTSQSTMIANVAQELVRQKFKTLVFANTHRNAEVINLIARRIRLRSAVHRAGLPMAYRNRVEDNFRRGNLDLLVSTPTLELGIDIGDLDAVVSMLVGITRLTQRIGRAGRKGQESIAVLALRNNDAISSYYREHPNEYFTDIDPAYVEPQNEVVARHQLLAASLDKPLTVKEFPAFQRTLQELIAEGLLQKTGQTLRANFSAARRELARYNIRGIGDTVQIVYAGKIIGERQMPIAQAELHPGAYYLHAGKTYESVDFEFRHGVGRAELEQLSPNHREMTQALRHVKPEITQVHETRTAYGITVYYANLRMTEVVTGFVTKDIYTDRILKTQDLDHPLEYTYPTKGFFFTAPPPIKTVNEVLDQPSDVLKYHHSQSNGSSEPLLEKEELEMGTFHALEHSLIESSDMLTGGGSQGIGGVSMGTSGVIFIYDGSPGGSGLAKLLYDRAEEAFRRVSFILRQCSCQTLDGCPACTYSYRCGNNNRPLFRAGANEVADLIISGTQTTTDDKVVPAEEPII
jgi:DEAD/DEAH box helicase domain-containing protein